MAASVGEVGDRLPLCSTEDEPEAGSEGLALGNLDITTEQLSLAGLEKELEAFSDSEVLAAILDQGAPGRGCGRRRCCRRCRHCRQPQTGRHPPAGLSLPPAGVDPREYSRKYEAKLRAAEVASIQDYIAESDSLAALHAQVPCRVRDGNGCSCLLSAVLPPRWPLSCLRRCCVSPSLLLSAVVAALPCAHMRAPPCLLHLCCLCLALHLQIKDCDGILVAMEGMLGKFQSDLGNVSAEIRSLQEQSSSMSVRLKNRRTVQVGAGAARAAQRQAGAGGQAGGAGAGLAQGLAGAGCGCGSAAEQQKSVAHNSMPDMNLFILCAGAAGVVHRARLHPSAAYFRHRAGGQAGRVQEQGCLASVPPPQGAAWCAAGPLRP